MAPPEWPMARLVIHMPSGQAFFKQELLRTALQRCLTRNNVPRIVSQDFISALSVSMLRLGILLADIFKGVDTLDLIRDFPAWNLFQESTFWQKSGIAELAQALSVARSSDSSCRRSQGDPRNRKSDAFFSFILMQDIRTDLAASNLPMHDIKVYFPMVMMPIVLVNCAHLGFSGSWNLQAPDEDSFKVSLPDDQNRRRSVAMYKQGAAKVSEIDSGDAFEYPLVERLYCAGLLSNNIMEVLASRKPRTRVKLEFRTALPRKGLRWDKLVPEKWDIMTLSPGKLITIGAKYIGQDVPLETVLHQYETFF